MCDDKWWAGTDVVGDGYDVLAVVSRDWTLLQNSQLMVF